MVLLRLDLNVPMDAGRVSDSTRIERVAPTIRELAERGARIALLSHLGRPKGGFDPALSLRSLVVPLSRALSGVAVRFVGDCVGETVKDYLATLGNGDVALLENLRFHDGEESNSPAFCRALAEQGDIFVNDAFAVSHRAHASIQGIAGLLPAYAGRLLEAELDALGRTLFDPTRPVVAIVGGAKVSTKIDLLANLVTRVDRLIMGGGMANTFLHAQGLNIGASLAENEMAETARAIERRAVANGCDIALPSDAVVATKLAPGVATRLVSVKDVPGNHMILDAGPASVARFMKIVDNCRTLLWNGPLGAFETPPFDRATIQMARHVAERTREGRILSVAGGGDTVSALVRAEADQHFSYVSTGGGAFLEWLEGKELPGISALATSP